MLHFFRKIRRDLLANSKFFRYLKYAIGEIVLVVLGILIALYINNQNEKRKELERFNQDLVNVEKELEWNIFVSRFYINILARNDSAYVKLFIDSLEITNHSFFNEMLTGGNPDWVAQGESYEKLDKSFKYDGKQDSILGLLKWLYGAEKDRIRYSEKELFDNREVNRQKFENYDWYLSWRFNDLSDTRIIDFYNNDPDYLALAAKNFGLNSKYRAAIQNYDIYAVNVYKTIFKYLDSCNLKHSDTLKFQNNPNDYKHYIGKYNAKWCSDNDFIFDDSCVVSMENGKYFWTGYRSDGPDTRFEIVPLDRYRFSDVRRWPGVYHLKFDEQGEVTGIIYSTGPSWNYVLEKIQ